MRTTLRPRLISPIIALLFASLILVSISLIESSAQTTKEGPCEEGRSAPRFSVAGTTENQARSFLENLQKAVAADDRSKVASMVRYPISAWTRNRNVRIRTRASFVASYPSIFTQSLKKTVENARTECLFVNWKGVMIHRGEIWLGAKADGSLQIITINGPIESESSGATTKKPVKKP